MHSVVSAQIGERLKGARKAANLTQDDVAKDFLVSRQAVSLWERGRPLPSVLQIYEMGILYGVSANFIVYGIPDRHTGGILESVFPAHSQK